jgi:hypothetical protein
MVILAPDSWLLYSHASLCQRQAWGLVNLLTPLKGILKIVPLKGVLKRVPFIWVRLLSNQECNLTVFNISGL